VKYLHDKNAFISEKDTTLIDTIYCIYQNLKRKFH